MAPVTRYASNGEASIAYQVVGEGGLDLLFLTGWITQIEQLWEAPANRRFLERLATFGRLILFDSRGTGLSTVCSSSTASSRRHRTRSRSSTPPEANGPPYSRMPWADSSEHSSPPIAPIESAPS